MMFTGTTQQQDTRFSDKEKKLMKQMKFGDCLNKRVDMSKVKLDILRPWISKKITDILHIEDDVVAEFVYNQLEEDKFPCPKKMQINMTGFLNGPNARQFMGELWSLLLSAQDSENGIPVEFVQQKKDDILKREEEAKAKERNNISRSGSREGRGGGSGRASSNSGREKESLSQRERERHLPPNTLSAIEQVRSQLSAKSRQSSEEGYKASGVYKNEMHDRVVKHDASPITNNDTVKKDRSSSRSKATANEKNCKGRSPRRSSIDAVKSKAESRDRYSPYRRRHSSHDKDKRRNSRSPRRKSPDRKRSSRCSRERRSRWHKSRSNTPQKRREPSRSRPKRSRSRSMQRGKSITSLRTFSPRRRHSGSHNSNLPQNGHESGRNATSRNPRNPFASKLAMEIRSPSRSRSRSHSRESPRNKVDILSLRNKTSPCFSRSRSQIPSSPKRKVNRSLSRQPSLSLSPEPNENDFELRRNKNSIQKKRQYRNNRDSSVSSVGRDTREQSRRDESRSRIVGASQFRRRSAGRNESSRRFGRHERSRSRSRRRSRSRQRSRTRNRSRSPRRYNRRRSPPQQHQYWGSRSGNSGRSNQWRRTQSRDRGNNHVDSRIDRHDSSQRRYSRERRISPFRKFSSPQRRASPIHREHRRLSRDQQVSSRDRRAGSAWRGSSRERVHTVNRWDQSSKNVYKPKQRSISANSNYEENNREEAIHCKQSNRHNSVERKRSIKRNSSSKRERSRSKSKERLQRDLSATDKIPVRASVEFTGPVIKTINLCKDESKESARKSQPQLTTEEKYKKQRTIRGNIHRNRSSISLSRTPSPFLKPHERKQLALEAHAVILAVQKKAIAIKQSNVKKCRSDRDSDSSSSDDSSDESEDSDEDEDSSDDPEEFEKKRHEKLRGKVIAKAKETKNVSHLSNQTGHNTEKLRSVNRKHQMTSSSESDTDQSSGDLAAEKPRPTASTKSVTKSMPTHKELRKVVPPADEEQRKRDKATNDVHDKRKAAVTSKQHTSSKTVSDASTVSTNKKLLVSASASGRNDSKRTPTNDSVEIFKVHIETKVPTAKLTGRKRTHSSSTSIPKRVRHHSVSSESSEQVVKRKRRKTKKSSSKRNSALDDSSSDSASESNKHLKKKTKKHKKHSSKKTRKHKKHKKKSKRTTAETTTSSDDVGQLRRRNEKSNKISNTTSTLLGGINEDLEKQLRERALKSMKKID